MDSLTQIKDASTLRDNTYSTAAAWLAFGLDLDRTVFYRQSDVPQVSELSWYLSCFFPYQRLTLAHSFKDKTDRLEDVNAGLFLALIAGEGPQAILEMVCASGGVAMHCQGSVDSIRSGYQRCRDLLAQGTVAAKFHEFRSACQSLQL